MNFKHIVILTFSLVFSSPLTADELSPAYLAFQEVSPNNFTVLWKRPINKAKPIFLELELPKGCETKGVENEWSDVAFSASSMLMFCVDGLTGKEIKIEGLERSVTDALVRIEFANGRTLVERLTPVRTGVVVAKEAGTTSIITSYFFLGMEHILSGVDHLLFVLCVMLLVSDKKKLLMAVTAFTLAHSITLVAATLGYVQLNPKVVEVLIALSIVLMAYEVIRAKRGITGLSTRYPWLVIFIFGLMHGLGFAGALSHIGLPQNDIPLALLFFNIGVEAGQLLFIGSILLLLLPFKKLLVQSDLKLVPVSSYLIGISASFWFFQRLTILLA